LLAPIPLEKLQSWASIFLHQLLPRTVKSNANSEWPTASHKMVVSDIAGIAYTVQPDCDICLRFTQPDSALLRVIYRTEDHPLQKLTATSSYPHWASFVIILCVQIPAEQSQPCSEIPERNQAGGLLQPSYW
jgi:hypothetical protein